ncbi:MAG: PQQ-binding-like beta-propeller repeat protein [Myxococcota bacterium]|jgi:outer membrane protein assembly factor BamB|nr:PQQ-binding-like beta-propeller repeat protein [Myxococcota bacterium]
MTKQPRALHVLYCAFLSIVVVFCFGAAGEICGNFLDTTAAAFGPSFADNKARDIGVISKRLSKAGKAHAAISNSLNTPVIAAVLDGDPRAVAAFDLKSGQKLWQVEAPVRSELTLGQDLVVFQAGNEVVAHALSDGHRVWDYEIEEGWDFFGAGVGDGVAALAIGVGGDEAGSYANGELVVLDARSGSVKWRNGSGGGLIGRPAVHAGLVFAPWDRQKVAIIDAESGEELARVRALDYTVNSVQADETGAYIGTSPTKGVVSSLTRIDKAVATGKREGSSVFLPSLSPVPGDPTFSRDAFARPVAGRSATEKIMFHGCTDTGATPVTFASGVYYLHYWRFIIAFDAATSQVRWTYASERDIESMNAVAQGALFVDSDGKIGFLDAGTGAEVWSALLGAKVLTASFDAASFAPASGGTPVSPIAGLKSILWDKDNRMLPIRTYSALLLAAIQAPEVTRDLLEIYSDAATPKGLRNAVVEALKRRTSGSEHLVSALHMRYDFLEQTQPPPMTVVAPALVNMQEKSSVPGLVEHLLDHETPIEYLEPIAKAIVALGDESTVGPLLMFLTLYHADSTFVGREASLVAVCEAMLKFGGESGQRYVLGVLHDPQTLPELATGINALLVPEAKEQAPAQVAKALVEKAPAPIVDALPFNLSPETINRTIATNRSVLVPCVQAALGTMPSLQSLRLSFILNGQTGQASDVRVLPSTISGLSDCVMNGLSHVDFPRFRSHNQRANYTIAISNQAGAASVFVPSGRPTEPQDADAWGEQVPTAPQAAPVPAPTPAPKAAPSPPATRVPPSPSASKAPPPPPAPTGDPDSF